MSDPTRKESPGVAALREDLGAVLAESQALRQDVHTAEVARRRATQVNIALLGLVALFVGLLVAIGWQNNQVIAGVDTAITSIDQTGEQIASCTTPGGQCYEEGRKRTDGAISAVVRISIFVSQCGRLWPGESGPEYDRQLEQCVMQRLRAATNPTPQPSPSASAPASPAPSATR